MFVNDGLKKVLDAYIASLLSTGGGFILLKNNFTPAADWDFADYDGVGYAASLNIVTVLGSPTATIVDGKATITAPEYSWENEDEEEMPVTLYGYAITDNTDTLIFIKKFDTPIVVPFGDTLDITIFLTAGQEE